jgi:hypothetical protein
MTADTVNTNLATTDLATTDLATTDLATTDLATQRVCFTAPLRPGATGLDREEMLSCWTGERTEDHVSSRRRHGIIREGVWIQSTPAGDVAVILIESPDLSSALAGIATSQEPFDVWFRGHLLAVHGMDLSAGMSLPEQVLDFRG